MGGGGGGLREGRGGRITVSYKLAGEQGAGIAQWLERRTRD